MKKLRTGPYARRLSLCKAADEEERVCHNNQKLMIVMVWFLDGEDGPDIMPFPLVKLYRLSRLTYPSQASVITPVPSPAPSFHAPSLHVSSLHAPSLHISSLHAPPLHPLPLGLLHPIPPLTYLSPPSSSVSLTPSYTF